MVDHPSSWAVSLAVKDEYSWDEEWVVRASSEGTLGRKDAGAHYRAVYAIQEDRNIRAFPD